MLEIRSVVKTRYFHVLSYDISEIPSCDFLKLLLGKKVANKWLNGAKEVVWDIKIHQLNR